MPKEPNLHDIDVSIRTVVMNEAQAKLAHIRELERLRTGAPSTSMATLGRLILTTWTPAATRPVGREEGMPTDAAGNQLTKRGHRKYVKEEHDEVPERLPNRSDKARAAQLLKHLRNVSDPERGTTLGPIAAVKKVASDEGLLDFVIEGKAFRKHVSAAERAVLKPLRFTLPEDVYQRIFTRLQAANCTITRALEVGLQEFARTGKIPQPKG